MSAKIVPFPQAPNRVAIMQPYFLPYLGYWRLLAAVDSFVILDDVNYIVRGWVNRNRILIHHNPKFITVPIQKASQNIFIDAHLIDDTQDWRGRMSRTVELAYARSPYYPEGRALLDRVLSCRSARLSEFLRASIAIVAGALGINVAKISPSLGGGAASLNGQDRVIDICKRLRADEYINLPGGRVLYSESAFRQNGIRLSFQEEGTCAAGSSGQGPGEPRLSILHDVMHEGLQSLRAQLASHDER